MNVPSDWNSWYRRCVVCGTRYHASEYCPRCADLEPCACGHGDWERSRDGRVFCCACGTEPGDAPEEADDEDR